MACLLMTIGMSVDYIAHVAYHFQTAVLTLLSMTIVCAIFMPNPCSVATASVSIASISTGVIGLMSQLSFDLDPIVMACLLMTIGMSVDYIAHVAYHFQVDTTSHFENGKIVKVRMESPRQRLEHTLQVVGWPMLQAGLSTVCCIFPLTFVRVLPAFLINLPEWLTRNQCCGSGRTRAGAGRTS
ncbi:hypothetical protein TELCIR_03994 [Teladorsagia circumcincta]|uniref:SSD domain-containing protein n=1 Tax=Teladorsagia circumcincta TaxID=45464 RepID=A0A2G9UUT6_TELCI|nr:hypothetical protein TELCIR_03994 [Teladorsagia circumcincta]